MLNDMDGIVIEIIEDDTFSNSEVLVGIFNYWLLEISVEFKYLSVVLEPLWCNSWDSIIRMLFS